MRPSGLGREVADLQCLRRELVPLQASELRNEDVENGIDVPPTKSVYMIQ